MGNVFVRIMMSILLKRWKRNAAKRTAGLQPYSGEWWTTLEESLTFIPKEQRKMVLGGLVGIGVSF
jgi:hypothetical protein